MTKFVRIEGARKPSDNRSWIAGEVAGCEFCDARLGKRLSSLLYQLGSSIGGTVPPACQDWANTKAAHRFFSNDEVDEKTILEGHFFATRDRVHANAGPLFILQDTTTISYKRDKPELVGFTGETISRKDDTGRWKRHTVCGILMHSSLGPVNTNEVRRRSARS
ncbi:transposase DNA-binding-containing protein [Variovorax paradoxus]|uniref:IS4/Tn5 family transposase DNA-binding protein n=1 Tax=Variovorax paradoxus TaxID=34073 RepID=UPI0009B73255